MRRRPKTSDLGGQCSGQFISALGGLCSRQFISALGSQCELQCREGVHHIQRDADRDLIELHILHTLRGWRPTTEQSFGPGLQYALSGVSSKLVQLGVYLCAWFAYSLIAALSRFARGLPGRQAITRAASAHRDLTLVASWDTIATPSKAPLCLLHGSTSVHNRYLSMAVCLLSIGIGFVRTIGP